MDPNDRSDLCSFHQGHCAAPESCRRFCPWCASADSLAREACRYLAAVATFDAAGCAPWPETRRLVTA